MLKYNGYEQDYAWVKHGMIFPFLEYLDRWAITHSTYFNLLKEISSFFIHLPLQFCSILLA